MAFDGTKPAYQDEILSQPLRDNFNYLKTQIDVEHNENGTHKDVLKKSGDVSTGDFGIKKNIPAIRLIGTEVNAQDIRIIETSGVVKLQKNLGTEASPVWNDFFTVNPSTYLIGTAKITEANLDPSTQIPDGRLAQIVTAGKIAESALPSTLAKLNTQNTFNNPQIIQGNDAGIYFDNNIDSLYKAEFKKNSDTTASILIKNKSDGSDVAAYSFSADGNLTTKKLTSQTQLVAQTQLISQIATGTPPLVVNSSTLVPNLYTARAAVADYVSNGGLPQLHQDYASSTTWVNPRYADPRYTIAIIQCWGGGGGGDWNAGGGGGGGYVSGVIPLAFLPQYVAINIGVGGSGGNYYGGISPTNGGSSTFHGLVAPGGAAAIDWGGSGGVAGYNTGVGTASGLSGGAGKPGQPASGGAGANGGAGGATNGQAGTYPGGGGAGAQPGNPYGGAGASGRVYIVCM